MLHGGGENESGAHAAEYRVRLLTDTPAAEDEFEAQAHEHVAEAIAQVIAAEPGGKILGLEGLWGSGKSTVVRLLRERLAHGGSDTADDIRVVVFDAWAHEGDPLRRTFLEALIRELRVAGWVDDASAKATSDELAGRTSSETTTSTSRLSLEGKLAAGATVLLALGAALFGNQFSHYHRLFAVLGAILLLAPLLVVGGLWIAKRAGKRAVAKGRSGGWWRAWAAIEPASFFSNDQTKETVTEGVQHGEPTSVEFERIFSRVLEAAVTPKRRLLLVLDNLDRVEEADARAILATMQTFTAAAHESNNWASRVWTLIPYDPGGLERLWSAAAASVPDREAQRESAGAPTLASAFLDKLFEVRFETPPLVLSDWRSYLSRLLHEALPDETEEVLQAILRLRVLYPGAVPGGAVAAEAPTPRQLKQFVNQVAAIRRQRDDVSLVHMAYYVMLRRDSTDIAADLINGSVPHAKLTHMFQAPVREDLAALYFGADRLLAQQLLLGPALEAAFSGGESQVVERLRERPGFLDALERLDLKARAAEGGIELTRAVAVLGRAGAFSVEQVSSWADAVLDPLAVETAIWRVQGRDTGVGLAILLNRVSSGDDERLTELLSRLAPAPVEADTEGRGHLEGVAGLLDELMELGRAGDAVRVTADIPAARLVDSLAYLGIETKPRATRTLYLVESAEGTAGALVEAAVLGRVAEADAALDMLLARPDRISLPALVSGSLTWLRANEPAGREQLALFLRWLDRARRMLDPESVLGNAADDGTLMHLVAVGMANSWYSEAGAASMQHLVVRPEFPDPPAASRLSPTGVTNTRGALTGLTPPELVSAQLEWLIEHKREAFPILVAIAKGAGRPWADEQVRALAESGALVTSVALFLPNWGYLRSTLGHDLFLLHERQLLDVDQNREKILAAIQDPQAALDSLAAAEAEPPAPYLQDVEGASAGILKATTAEGWKAALLAPAESSLVSLAVRLSESKAAPTNPPGLQEALHEHFRALADEEAAWQPDGLTFRKLTRLLGAPSRRVLASQLCAELEGRDGQVGPLLFPTYGEFLGSESAFRTHAKLPNVIERFVARDQWPVVAWFVDLAGRESDALADTGRRDEMEHLKAAVTEKLQAAGESVPEELAELASLLGVPKEPSED